MTLDPATFSASVLIAHAVATLLMTGLIWFVQLVHYPLFARLHPETAPAYEREHQRRTTWIVAPLMAIEVVSAVCIMLLPTPPNMLLAYLGLALLGAVWASTFFVQVPDHERFARAFELQVARRLAMTNWLRTIAWSARSVIAVILLVEGI